MPDQDDSFHTGRAAIPDDETARQPTAADQHPTAELPEVDTGTGWPDGDTRAVARRPVLTRDKTTEAIETEEFYDRPARRRIPGGCLFYLAGFVALLVVLALGLKVVGLWPNLHNPFGSKTTDRSQPTLLLSIQDLSRFEAASGNFQVIIDVQKDRAYIPDLVFSDRTLFVAAGTVDAYVDFSNIGSGAIKDSADHRSATIRLPAPALEQANLDQGKSYVYAEQRGLWNRLTSIFTDNPNKMQELYRYGTQKINEAALQSDLPQRAADNTRKMLEQLLRSLGYTSITIIFANP
ncbi:MAG TPA: DUF4230 domain-containing protein [Rugosimonospora sp.]|nr:DUF4230 domain-containing protein [Rugosimonospora sp.]